MWKFVFGPIARALEEREERARASAIAAEDARAEIELMKARIQEDLEQARQEASEQVQAAKARAAEREKELLATAKEEAAKERARASAEIEQSLQKARETLREETVQIGLDVAKQILGREFSNEDQSRMLSEFQNQINKQ